MELNIPDESQAFAKKVKNLPARKLPIRRSLLQESCNKALLRLFYLQKSE